MIRHNVPAPYSRQRSLIGKVEILTMGAKYKRRSLWCWEGTWYKWQASLVAMGMRVNVWACERAPSLQKKWRQEQKEREPEREGERERGKDQSRSPRENGSTGVRTCAHTERLLCKKQGRTAVRTLTIFSCASNVLAMRENKRQWERNRVVENILFFVSLSLARSLLVTLTLSHSCFLSFVCCFSLMISMTIRAPAVVASKFLYNCRPCFVVHASKLAFSTFAHDLHDRPASPKVTELVEGISKLSLLETVDLVKYLKVEHKRARVVAKELEWRTLCISIRLYI